MHRSRLAVGLISQWWPASVGSGMMKAYLAMVTTPTATPGTVIFMPEKSHGALIETFFSPPDRATDRIVVFMAFSYNLSPFLSSRVMTGVTPAPSNLPSL